MRILGIDPGYGIVGWGIIDKKRDGSVHAVDYGAIQTPASESLPARLAMIYEHIGDIVKNYKVKEIAIEEIFFYSNQKTAIKVSEARGVILLAATQNCGKLYEYTPMQIKQAITGKGRAEKRHVEETVKEILQINEKMKPDDIADALAVALCHAQSTKAQKEGSCA